MAEEQDLEENIEKIEDGSLEETAKENTEQIEENRLEQAEETNEDLPKQEMKIPKRQKMSFDSIVGDESLPEVSDESKDNFHVRIKKMANKSQENTAYPGIPFTKLIVVVIVIIGLIMVAIELRDEPIARNNLLIFDVPKISTSVYSEDGLPYNVIIELSLGIRANDTSGVNSNECYNIICDTISNMPYEKFESANAQNEVKNAIQDSLLTQSLEPLSANVYISSMEIKEGYVPNSQ